MVVNFHGKGCPTFGAGAIAGIAIAAAPASFVSISAALSGVNSAINQGFNKGWSNINFQQVAGNTLMGGATAFAGRQLGKAIATPLENALGSVSSPLRFMIGSEITNTTIGSLFGGISETSRGGSFWKGAWNGAKMGLVTGAISGLGAATQYSIDHQVNMLTGKSIAQKEIGQIDLSFSSK